MAPFVLLGPFVFVLYNDYRQLRDRHAMLRALVERNAPLDQVVATYGNFRLTRRGTPEWDEIVKKGREGSKSEKRIVEWMERAAAIGRSSPQWNEFWIFLDENDRLVDFMSPM